MSANKVPKIVGKGKRPAPAENVNDEEQDIEMAEESGAEGSDVPDMIEQDPQERRQIRQQYRHLLETVEGI